MSRIKTNLEEGMYLSRRTKLLRQIKGESAIIFSAAETTSSRDQHHPYCSDTDLLYFTGFDEPGSALVLMGTTQGPRSVLYLRERDAAAEQWTGERLGLKRAKRRFQVDEVRDIKTLKADLPGLVLNCRALHFNPGANPDYDQAVWKLFAQPTAPRLQYPNVLKDIRLITAEMRFVKDKFEIQALRHAADITARSFQMLLPNLKEVTSEKHAATLLESYFTKLGAHGLAFATTVASGKNAVYLHHTPQLQPLWKRELVLVDAGASFRRYTGDITRTFPAGGKFTSAQADLYDVVHSALVAGIARSRPDSSLDDVHEAVVKQITRGLVDLKILKGNPSDLIEEGAYRSFFMHRTGHWLGLDVHDIAPVSHTGASGTTLYFPASMRPFVPGVVFTVEPGVYIDPRDTSVPVHFRGMGIRLEDDVLITSNGSEVLTEKAPLNRQEIETLML